MLEMEFGNGDIDDGQVCDDLNIDCLFCSQTKLELQDSLEAKNQLETEL